MEREDLEDSRLGMALVRFGSGEGVFVADGEGGIAKIFGR
jgi:hypothetical protein